jgi:hypothetical protein
MVLRFKLGTLHTRKTGQNPYFRFGDSGAEID